ncbi:unnamed protein product [Musa acuminata var. zebrina]
MIYGAFECNLVWSCCTGLFLCPISLCEYKPRLSLLDVKPGEHLIGIPSLSADSSPAFGRELLSTIMLSSTLPAAPQRGRRLLLLDELAPVASPNSRGRSSYDADVIMILAVVLCALIGVVVASFVVRCVLRVARWAWLEPHAARPCLADLLVAAAAARVKGEQAATAGSGLIVYSGEPVGGSECAICLSEFAPGERVRVLPGCNHGFHVHCIDRWLASRLSCPTCRRSLFGKCSAASDGDHAVH